jgi:hypothetical protein
MMLRSLSTVFVSAVLAPTLAAQLVLQDEITRVENPWPASAQGVVTDLVAGAFRIGHPGRSAVMLRNGALELCYQPAVLQHWVSAGGSGLTRIATIPGGSQGRCDRLAALSAAGLHVMGLGPSGFATLGAGPFANWIGLVEVKAVIVPYQGVQTPLMLGIGPTGVKVATIGPNVSVVPVADLPVPPTMQLLDAVLVDWVAGGLPEVVALTTSGTFVIDIATLSVVEQLTSITTGAGFLAQLPDGAFVVQLTQAGTDWRVVTMMPGQTFDTEPVFSLAKPPTGLVTGRWNEDDFPDVIVSTGELVRHVLTGDADGPRSALAHRVQITDYAGAPPGGQVDNVAAAIVDDIDYDGEKDLLAVNQTSGKLVLTRELRRQIVANDPGSQIPVTLDTQTGVRLEAVIGYHHGFPGTNAPANWQTGLSPLLEDSLAVRCSLPSGWENEQKLLVTTYPLVASGSPSGDDTVDTAGGMTLAYTLQQGNVNTEFLAELVVLFDRSLVTAADPVPIWGSGQRYVVEYLLCKPNAQGGFETVGEPAFTIFGAKHSFGQSWQTLQTLIGLEEQVAEIAESWWVDDTGNVEWVSPWPDASPQTPPDESNRWVGWNPVIRRKKSAPTLPATVETADMGNAIVHE